MLPLIESANIRKLQSEDSMTRLERARQNSRSAIREFPKASIGRALARWFLARLKTIEGLESRIRIESRGMRNEIFGGFFERLDDRRSFD